MGLRKYFYQFVNVRTDAYTFSSSVTKRQRKQIYSNGVAVIGITVFMQFFWINEYSVWWNIPGTMGYVSIYGIIGEKAKGYVACMQSDSCNNVF